MKKMALALVLAGLALFCARPALACQCINGVPNACVWVNGAWSCTPDIGCSTAACPWPVTTGGDDTATTPDVTPPVSQDTVTGGAGGTGGGAVLDKQFLQDKYEIYAGGLGGEEGIQDIDLGALVPSAGQSCRFLLSVLWHHLNPQAAKEARQAELDTSAALAKRGIGRASPLYSYTTLFDALAALAKLSKECPVTYKKLVREAGEGTVLATKPKDFSLLVTELAAYKPKTNEGFKITETQFDDDLVIDLPEVKKIDEKIKAVDEKLTAIDEFREKAKAARERYAKAKMELEIASETLARVRKSYEKYLNDPAAMIRRSAEEITGLKVTEGDLWTSGNSGILVEAALVAQLDSEAVKANVEFQLGLYNKAKAEFDQAKDAHDPLAGRADEMEKWAGELNRERAELKSKRLEAIAKAGRPS